MAGVRDHVALLLTPVQRWTLARLAMLAVAGVPLVAVWHGLAPRRSVVHEMDLTATVLSLQMAPDASGPLAPGEQRRVARVALPSGGEAQVLLHGSAGYGAGQPLALRMRVYDDGSREVAQLR